jgi:ribosomal protein S18 acetylase RimI-like enzyme
MFRVQKMEPKHFAAAVELANTMDWHMTKEDFAFNAQLEPDGALVLLDDAAVVGTATCVSYGQVGWFGNLIVDSRYRRQGLGNRLLEHAIHILQSKGVVTVGLYAYLHLVDFYGRAGFVQDADFVVLKADKVHSSSNNAPNIRSISEAELTQIIKLDAECFGAPRQKLLQAILSNPNNPCYCAFEDDNLLGFVAAKMYEGAAEVGPLACKKRHPQTASALLHRVLADIEGYEAYLYLPAAESALLQLATQAGFIEQFRLACMFLGQSTAKKCIYSSESLERG